jgi:hypothetical protein
LDSDTIGIFGDWDYLSHQVPASPMKPIDYMDKMDIFGYTYIPGYKPTIARYLAIEIKKDLSRAEDVDQIMKYVDWIVKEYAHGDYSMVEAFLIAFDFESGTREYQKKSGVRTFTTGMKPAKTAEWANLSLVRYRYNNATGKLDFALV